MEWATNIGVELAPTADILSPFQKGSTGWSHYEKQFLALMSERKIEETISRPALERACLLCSEATPHHCHRRLVAEYFRIKWGDVEIEHL